MDNMARDKELITHMVVNIQVIIVEVIIIVLVIHKQE
jgi:hypothetical protein